MSRADLPESLTTFAPPLDDPPDVTVTGNLIVSLPEINLSDGAVARLGVLHDGLAGVLEAHGGDDVAFAQPVLQIGGRPAPLAGLRWQHDGDWVPRFTADTDHGQIEGTYVAPLDSYGGEHGIALRLSFVNTTDTQIDVALGWRGQWAGTQLSHFRPKSLDAQISGRDDLWTGSRVLELHSSTPLLSLAVRAGEVVTLEASAGRWQGLRSLSLPPGERVSAVVYVAVASEPDGASATALHLRRRGFDAMVEETLAWLEARQLAIKDTTLSKTVNRHLYFCYFFAQGDCLDTGRPALVTSRSPHYYVSGALWSRDAFWWTFPALLLSDERRARDVLVETLRSAGPRLADHALYLNGTRMYPGFELDQAAAPVLAIWRYVRETGDVGICREPAVRAYLEGFPAMLAPWWNDELGLYATFLLPTDDLTDHPYVASCNAFVAAALEGLGDLLRFSRPEGVDPGEEASDGHGKQAQRIRASVREKLRVDGPHGRQYAWACDAAGATELRDEPPLGLRLLAYLGVGSEDDADLAATVSWIEKSNPYSFPGRYGGCGSPHFPHPSGFDLASRMLTSPSDDTAPLSQLASLPLDHGLGCESWDAVTGAVRTGAAMASMSGLLAWTAWARTVGHRRWDAPLRLTPACVQSDHT